MQICQIGIKGKIFYISNKKYFGQAVLKLTPNVQGSLQPENSVLSQPTC